MELISLTETELNKIHQIETELISEIDRICVKHDLRYFVAYGSLIGAIRHKGFIPWDDDIDICMPRQDYQRFREICKTELDDRFFYQTHATDKAYYYPFDKIRANGTVFKESFLSHHDIHHGVYVDIFPVDAVPEEESAFLRQYRKYRICRTVLMSKYLNLKARKGKKRIAAAVIRVLTFPVSLEYLYRKAEQIAQQYNDRPATRGLNFFSVYKRKEVFPMEYFEKMQRADFEGITVSIPAHYDEILTGIYGNYMRKPPVEQQNTQHDLVELKL